MARTRGKLAGSTWAWTDAGGFATNRTLLTFDGGADGADAARATLARAAGAPDGRRAADRTAWCGWCGTS